MTSRSKPCRNVGSLEEMQQRCWEWTERPNGQRVVAGSAYNRYLLRPISLRVTRVLVRFGVRANTITLAMIAVGLLGVACAIPHVAWLAVVAALALALFDLLDAVDGEIARWHGSSSTKGLYLDKIAHLLVAHPSLGIPAFHYYAVTDSVSYLILGIIAVTTSLMAWAARETLFRINAEAAQQIGQTGSTVDTRAPSTNRVFFRLCRVIKQSAVLAFPITKSRVVHIVSLIAIAASFQGVPGGLRILAWFYAVYCATRLAIEIPYFYHARVADVPYEKPPSRYRWPI